MTTATGGTHHVARKRVDVKITTGVDGAITGEMYVANNMRLTDTYTRTASATSVDQHFLVKRDATTKDDWAAELSPMLRVVTNNLDGTAGLARKHGRRTGDAIKLETTSGLPAGLSAGTAAAGTTYYVRKVSATSAANTLHGDELITLHTTQAGALNLNPVTCPVGYGLDVEASAPNAGLTGYSLGARKCATCVTGFNAATHTVTYTGGRCARELWHRCGRLHLRRRLQRHAGYQIGRAHV